MITKITNYKLKEFLKQPIEIIQSHLEVLRYHQAIITKKTIYHLPLKDVEFIKENIGGQDDDKIIEIIEMVQSIRRKDVLNLRITDFFGIFNSIKNQITTIVDAEESLTSEHINVKWETVEGSKRLSKFGLYNILDSLADGDILKYQSILELPYSDVFTKLLMNKTREDLNHEMSKLKTIN